MSDAFSITITTRAVDRLRAMTGRNDEIALRVSIEGGGCSGYQYIYELDPQVTADDCIVMSQGCKLVIDIYSKPLLHRAEVDFIEDLGQAYFKITNPQASINCGCGNSFGV